MRRQCASILSGLAAVWGVAASSAGAGPMTIPAKPDLPLEGVITNPDWAVRPSGEDVGRFYPPFAQLIRLSGYAQISCGVATTGSLQGCVIITEVPVGIGFGPAAVGLSHLFRMRPRLLDGQPVTGGVVRIPIRFQMARDSIDVPEDVAASAPPRPTPPSALALGRRLAALWGGSANGDWLDSQMETVSAALAANSTTREQQLALVAFQQAVAAAEPARAERAARAYAASMSEPVLAQVVAFLETPAGKAWASAAAAQQRSDAVVTVGAETAIMVDARSRLCRQITCLPEDNPPSPATATQGGGTRTP